MKSCFVFLVLWLLSALPLLAVDYASALPEDKDIDWYDPVSEPFRIYGVNAPDKEHGFYYRVPECVAKQVSPVFTMLSHHTAGGRIRFVTDSSLVAIHLAEWEGIPRTNLAYTFSNCVDVYTAEKKQKSTYTGTVFPVSADYNGFDGIIRLPGTLCTVTINMPGYCGVKELYVGLEKGCRLERAGDYKTEKPLVFYGSSITQGECASRPGNSYESILSRSLDCNYINLGFSGNALGEQAVAEYIAGLDMTAFVMDYDHNAPSPEHLKKTHYEFYRTVRRLNPQLPIIMVSRPNPVLTSENRERLEIIKESWRKAMNAGDRNVYLVPGCEFMQGYSSDAWTIDNVHPNDFGMVMIAKRLEKLIKPLLETKSRR